MAGYATFEGLGNGGELCMHVDIDARTRRRSHRLTLLYSSKDKPKDCIHLHEIIYCGFIDIIPNEIY